MKTYPSDDRLTLIVADDLRQELGQKISVIGMYANNRLEVPKESNPPFHIPSIALLMWFLDGNGKFTINIDITSPSGKSIPQKPLDNRELEMQESGALTLMLKLAPFVVSEFGAYQCRVLIDDREYVRSFDVVRSPA